MEEYRIDIKVRNNLILTKIEEQGYSSPLSFCNATGISYPKLISFLNMKESIFDFQGNIKKFVMKLCNELNCMPEEIFSASQMEANLENNKRTLEVNEAEAKFMLSQENNQKLLEDHYADNQLSNNIENLLLILTPRERKVIEMRMGLGDYSREHLFEEIGLSLNVSRERVRQIEAKALRKCRHPFASEKLREHIKVD